MYKTNLVPVVEDTAVNRDVLREGVIGVDCLFAGRVEDKTKHLTHAMIDILLAQVPLMHTLGTIEVYSNGRVNAYVKRDGKVTDMIIVTPQFDMSAMQILQREG